MTDRELLELAAKAIGLTPTVNCNDEPSWTTGHGSGCFTWNPLADDGDAFRLAVTLNINVHKGFAYTPTGQLFDCTRLAQPIAATRRAIVMAAAAIGASMP